MDERRVTRRAFGSSARWPFGLSVYAAFAVAVAVLCFATLTEGASPREESVVIVGNPDRVKDCQLLGTAPGWRDKTKKSGAVALAEAHGAYSNPNIEIRVLHVSGADDEVYACGGTFEDPMKDPTNCSWTVALPEATPPIKWCGNITIAKARASVSGSAVKGVIWIKNRGKREVSLTLKITALNGDDVVGATTFPHFIGDDTTDTKHFTVTGDKGKTPTKLLITIVTK
jgi:hypothetical protein